LTNLLFDKGRSMKKFLFPLLLAIQLTFIIKIKTVLAQEVNPMVVPGNGYTVVLKADGTVWSWGEGQSGEMGNAILYDTPVLAPVQASIADVKYIAVGNNCTYAIKKDGTLWAWGFNGNGELGVGDTTIRTVPVQIPGLNDVVRVAGTNGGFAACVKVDGTVYAWGWNSKGQLGNGTTTHSTSPVQSTADGFENIKELDVGADHVVARKGDGAVWTWGSNAGKQCGRGTSAYYTRPGPISTTGMENIVKVKAGSAHNVALKNDGTVWTWGSNKYGQLGKGYVLDGYDGEYLNNRSYNPAPVDGLSDIGDVDAGGYQTLVKKSDGTIWFVGYNYRGQFGDGNALLYIPYAADQWRRSLIEGPFLQVETFVDNTGFLKSDGTVWTCGANSRGQVGTGGTSLYIDVPFRVGQLNLIAAQVLAGDVDGSGQLTLADVLAALQIVTGGSPGAAPRLQADVNGDGQIGMAEAIYILHNLSKLRQE
jgi:alpha-tubulin suppressor-like RCC1 family protein